MCRDIAGVHIFKYIYVDRCPVYTSLKQMCRKIPKKHIFRIDVEGIYIACTSLR